MMRRRPAWKKVDKERLALDVVALKDTASEELWGSVKNIVERLPRARRLMGRCKYWNDDLEWIRLDTMRMRRGIVYGTVSKEDYDLVRRVYRNTLTARRCEWIREAIEKADNASLFRQGWKLEARRVLPSMIDGNSATVTMDEGISDLIAEQLSPGVKQEGTFPVVDVEGATELDIAIRQLPV